MFSRMARYLYKVPGAFNEGLQSSGSSHLNHTLKLPGMGPQEARGPGVLREDDAAVLQCGQLTLQPLHLIGVLMAPHVCQGLTPCQCCTC